MYVTIYMIDDNSLGEIWYLNTSDARCFISDDGYMPSKGDIYETDSDIHDEIVRNGNMSIRAIDDTRKDIIEWLEVNDITYVAPILNACINNIRCKIEDEKLAATFLLTFG